MFNVSVFILLSTVVVAANLIAIPRIINQTTYYKRADERKILLISALSNNIFLSIGAAAVGCYMTPKVGLSSPLLNALTSMEEPHIKLFNLLLPASTNSMLILLGILLFQIVLVNRCITLPNFFSLPISTKILKEGVLEEVIYRWGLLPIAIRILTVEFSLDIETAIFIAIFISALGSAMSHISDLRSFSIHRLNLAVVSVLTVNFWGAILYGWLFCQFGLMAAIISHSTVIIVSSTAHRFKCFFFSEEINH